MGLEIQLGKFSDSGAQVGDYVEVKYTQNSGGQYVLTRNVSVDSNSDDNSDD
jgi:hypothetical protein